MGCAGKVPATGDSGNTDGDIDGNKALNFLKFRSEIIEKTEGVVVGITYKINDGDIRSSHVSADRDSTLSVFGAGSDSGLTNYFLGYEPDLLDRGQAAGLFVPMSLDQNSSYLFGMNNTLFAEFFAALGQTLPDGFTGIDGETVLTLYPASKLPSTNINYDLFNLIIDPTNYTQADLKYFADRGATPAIKNADGSYTLKSQLSMPTMG